MPNVAQAEIVNTALIAGGCQASSALALANDDGADATVVAFRRGSGMSGNLRGGGEVGSIRETIGATHAKVDLLLSRMEEDRRERRDAEDKIWMELRAIKHDQNNREQVLSLRLEMSDRRAGETERRLGEVESAMKQVNGLLAELQKPVKQIVELRSRMGWLGAIITAVLVAVWAIGKPLYDGWIAGWFQPKQ